MRVEYLRWTVRSQRHERLFTKGVEAMKMSKMLIVVLCGSLMMATVSISGQIVNQSDNLLNREAKGANLKNVMVGQALVNALIDAGAPGGVATVDDCNE